MQVIAEQPTPEMYATGLEIDCQCARCGSSCYWVDCNDCEDGYQNRHDENPLWYDDEYDQPCHICRTRGGWQVCGSGGEWCTANPMRGRENVPNGAIEWFTVGTPTPTREDE